MHADSDNTELCPPCMSSSAVWGSSSCRFLSIDVVVAIGVGVATGKASLDPVIVSNVLDKVAASSEGKVSGIERKGEEKKGRS